jgi:predicted lipoprotein with Yx(FWY)xxD motif
LEKKMKKNTQILLMALTFTITVLAGNVYAGEKILTNKAGMTLYTFDKDSEGNSVCYGPCAVKWPPYAAASDATAKQDWEITTRKDGSKQWAFNGQPLYTWIGDTKAGDNTGDGVGGVWHTAKN